MSGRVIVVDTVGRSRSLHPAFRQALAHVDFIGHSPDAWMDTQGSVHPHGGWCAWHILAQSIEPTECHLVQYLAPDGHPQGDPRGLDAWLFETLHALDLDGTDTVSCSWGASREGRFTADWMRRLRESCGRATIYFAAGNQGKQTRSWPQSHAGAVAHCYVVGAITRIGARAEFSSAVTDGPYIHLAALGDGGMALDPFTGQIVPWRGTSQACPRVAGAMRAHGLVGGDVIPYARAHALSDPDGDGLPTGIDLRWREVIASGGWNPEVGAGNVESMVQERLRATGMALGSWRAGVAGVTLDLEGVRMDIPPLERDS